MKIVYDETKNAPEDFSSLSEETQIDMAKIIIQQNMDFQYIKRKKAIELYCPNCQDYAKYSNEQFKEIRYSKVCPKCRCTGNLKEYKKPITVYGFNWIDNADGFYGYETDVTFRFKKEFSIKTRFVLKNIQSGMYVKGLYLPQGMYSEVKPCWVYGEVFPRNKQWRKVYSQRYAYTFNEYVGFRQKTKKEILDYYKKLNYKSNQIKLILDHPFNEQQMKAIKLFDLKTPDEVYKNRVYIRNYLYGVDSDEYNYNFNVSTLNYLYKYNIPYNLYIDYARMCKIVNRKLDKPKDFHLWHDRVSEMVAVVQIQNLEKNIKSRYEELKQFELHKKNVDIKPFKTKKEIQNISKCLHNCMSRLYMDEYANGSTDLYHLDIDGKPLLAIEILDGKLKQCYGDHNEKPEPKYKKVVDKWYKEVIQAV